MNNGSFQLSGICFAICYDFFFIIFAPHKFNY